MSDQRRTLSAMAVNRTVEVPADALLKVVCVFDGLVRALEGVATSGRSAYRESARKDVQTLRELRAELVPGNVDWMAGSYDADTSWYASITFAFTDGSCA